MCTGSTDRRASSTMRAPTALSATTTSGPKCWRPWLWRIALATRRRVRGPPSSRSSSAAASPAAARNSFEPQRSGRIGKSSQLEAHGLLRFGFLTQQQGELVKLGGCLWQEPLSEPRVRIVSPAAARLLRHAQPLTGTASHPTVRALAVLQMQGFGLRGAAKPMQALFELSWQGWLTLVVVGAATAAMAREKLGPDLVMFSALCVLVVCGVVEPARALLGFSQPAVATIAVLLVVAGAVQETGALRLVSGAILGTTRQPTMVMLRLVVPTAALSAFVNNTPIVAMFIPMVRTHARVLGISPSKLLIPLAYASMFGGTCTMIGTSANLVVGGMLDEAGVPGIGILEIAWIGLPTTLVGVLYLTTVGRHLLPDRADPSDVALAEARDYLVELEVSYGSPLVGQTIEQAGLRALEGLYLVEIRRADGRILNPVAPHNLLVGGDHLVFTGIASTVEDLVGQFPGLNAVDGERQFGIDDHHLFEVVISHRSTLVGHTVRAADFRRRFNAAILAVHRSGARIEGKIGDIVLEAGDVLMLTAAPGFRRAWQDSPAFYLVSALSNDRPRRYARARLVLLVVGAMVLVPAFTDVPLLVSAMGALVVLLGTDCLGLRTARTSLNGTVLVLIGSAFGLAAAMEASGAASAIATLLLEVTQPLGPRATLAAIYLLGVAMASFVSNAASAALVFPIALTAAQMQGLDARPFAIALAMAASAGLSTPIGCPPNLLVYGLGGYRYLDFTRIGLPLNVMFWVLAVLWIPEVWPFEP